MYSFFFFNFNSLDLECPSIHIPNRDMRVGIRIEAWPSKASRNHDGGYEPAWEVYQNPSPRAWRDSGQYPRVLYDLLLGIANEDHTISREFCPSFSLEMRIKRGLFSLSFIPFSQGKYYEKRDHCGGVPCFLLRNANESITLIGCVFKAVSYPIMSMRPYYGYPKTPADCPPEDHSLGRAGICIRVFSYSFNSLILKEYACCFIFLVSKKQQDKQNKAITGSLIQSIYFSDEKNIIVFIGDAPASRPLVLTHSNGIYIILSSGCNEMSYPIGKIVKAPRAEISLRMATRR